MIYIVALSVGVKCPCKIHLNTECGGGSKIKEKGANVLYGRPKGTLQKNLVSVLLADCRYLILEPLHKHAFKSDHVQWFLRLSQT